MKSEGLTECLSNIVAQHPFFATYLYSNMDIKEDVNVQGGTAATDGKTITTNPEWFNAKPIEERVFIMCHEILHGILDHPGRGKLYADRGFGPDLKPWHHDTANKSQDYIINDILKKAGIGRMPESGGLHDETIATAESLMDEVYVEQNAKRHDPDSPDKSDGGGNGSGPKGHGGFDNHQQPKAADVKGEQEQKTAIAQAAQAAEAMGKMPASLKRMVGTILDPEISWEDQLRKSMTSRQGMDTTTWQRPNRRRLAIAPHIYMPGRTGHQIGGLVLCIDVSGSIDQAALDAFFAECAGVLNEVKAEWIKVIPFNTQAQCEDGGWDIENADDLMDLDIKGGGGTKLERLYAYLEEHDIYPEHVIFFTDGITTYTQPPIGYDVTWVLTTDRREPPYGTKIYMK